MMLEQEIEKYLSEQTLCRCDSVSYRNIKNLIFGFTEPREKCIAELEKENAELKSIADFQTSSNMDRYFQLKRSKEQLTKAKEIIRELLKTPASKYERIDGEIVPCFNPEYKKIKAEAEQFLKDCEVEK